MKATFLVLIALVGLALISCESKSGKKLAQTDEESTELIQPEPQVTPSPRFVNYEEHIIGVPKSIVYAIELNSWNLSLEVANESGYAYSIEIDSLTAMQIIQDKDIAAVQVKGKSITLLR